MINEELFIKSALTTSNAYNFGLNITDSMSVKDAINNQFNN